MNERRERGGREYQPMHSDGTDMYDTADEQFWQMHGMTSEGRPAPPEVAEPTLEERFAPLEKVFPAIAHLARQNMEATIQLQRIVGELEKKVAYLQMTAGGKHTRN